MSISNPKGFLFPENSDKNIELNNLLKYLYSFDSNKYLKILNNNIESSLPELNTIYSDIKKSEEISKQFASFGYKNYEAIGKIGEIVLLKDKYESKLESICLEKNEDIVRSIKEIKNNKKNLNALRKIRHATNSIDDILWGDKYSVGVFGLANKSPSKIAKKYHLSREQIEQIDTNITAVVNRYQNFEISENQDKELKSLMKETKTGLFKGTIAIECLNAMYYEGVIFLKSLNEEIKDVKSDSDHYIKKKKTITAEIQKLEMYEKTLSDFDMKMSKIDLNNLLEIQKKNDKEKFKEETSIYLSEVKHNFEELSGVVANKISGMFKGNENRIYELQKEKKINTKSIISDKVVYEARDGRVWDVRDFIQADNVLLKKDVIDKYSLDKGSLDDIAYKCMIWVQNNIKYTPDPQITNHLEEWLFPSETVQTSKGDCEDGTNLIISLMRNAGVPAYRVKNACGEVPEGGHSWPLYLRESDDEWVNLDFSYKPSDIPINKRSKANQIMDYKKIWFSFNDEHSWAENSIDLYKSKFYKNKPESPFEIVAIPIKPRIKKKNNSLETASQNNQIIKKTIAPKIDYVPKETYETNKEEVIKPTKICEPIVASTKTYKKDTKTVKRNMPEKKNNKLSAQIFDKPFLISSYVWDLGVPDNYKFYKIRDLLISGDGLKTWKERFSKLEKVISYSKITNEQDFNYLESIAAGIDKAINNPGHFFDVSSAKKAYKIANNSLENFSKQYFSIAV